MSPDNNNNPPTFLNRDQLAFQEGVVFELAVTSQANFAADITIRGFTKEGPFTLRATTLNTGAKQTDVFRIPDIPIMISVIDDGDNFNQGDAYVTLNLRINGDLMFGLCAGLVSSTRAISWPTPTIENPIPNRGGMRQITGTNPAAGSEISETVPTGRQWLVHGVKFALVTAATAGSRRPHLVFNLTSTFEFNCFASIDQIISENKQYSCGEYGVVPDETDDNDIIIPIPTNIWLPAGGTIKTQTTNLAAGDDYSAPTLFVEEFFYRP